MRRSKAATSPLHGYSGLCRPGCRISPVLCIPTVSLRIESWKMRPEVSRICECHSWWTSGRHPWQRRRAASPPCVILPSAGEFPARPGQTPPQPKPSRRSQQKQTRLLETRKRAKSVEWSEPAQPVGRTVRQRPLENEFLRPFEARQHVRRSIEGKSARDGVARARIDAG